MRDEVDDRGRPLLYSVSRVLSILLEFVYLGTEFGELATVCESETHGRCTSRPSSLVRAHKNLCWHHLRTRPTTRSQLKSLTAAHILRRGILDFTIVCQKSESAVFWAPQTLPVLRATRSRPLTVIRWPRIFRSEEVSALIFNEMAKASFTPIESPAPSPGTLPSLPEAPVSAPLLSLYMRD